MRATIVLTTTIFLAGCSGTGSGPPVEKLDQAVLLDVQGLFGGLNLWISADGKAICSFVAPPGPEAKGAPGFQESRYEVVLSQEQRATLLGLVNKHGFFSIKTRERSGVPDEARPMIYIKSGAKAHAVAKWAGDTHKDFDPIYQFLRKTAEAMKSGEAVYRGAYQQWEPEGFPTAKSIVETTAPKLD
jgi:hypothetical protein